MHFFPPWKSSFFFHLFLKRLYLLSFYPPLFSSCSLLFLFCRSHVVSVLFKDASFLKHISQSFSEIHSSKRWCSLFPIYKIFTRSFNFHKPLSKVSSVEICSLPQVGCMGSHGHYLCLSVCDRQVLFSSLPEELVHGHCSEFPVTCRHLYYWGSILFTYCLILSDFEIMIYKGNWSS